MGNALLTIYSLLLRLITGDELVLSDKQLNDGTPQHLAAIADDYLTALLNAHHLTADDNPIDDQNTRSKRSPQTYGQNGDSFTDNGVHRLRSIVPLMTTCEASVDFTTIPFNGQTYGICVSRSMGQKSAKVSVGAITGNGWQRDLISWSVIDPQKVVAFVDEDKDSKDPNLYVLVADSAVSDGTNLYVINKYNKMITKEQLTVNSKWPTAIAVWWSRSDTSYHLAIANSNGKDSSQTYKSNTSVYHWKQTYFDRYSEMTTYYVKDICPFNIHSNEFIAVANYKAGPNQMAVESEIFKLDIDRKKWRSFQRIRTFGAVDWEFFAIGDDRNKEYFLVVANSFAINNGQKVNSMIYKFSDDRFVLFQSLATIGATQLDSYIGSKGEFVLAVADNDPNQALHFYQYNGWRFVSASFQHKIPVWGPGVASLHFSYLPIHRSVILVVSNPNQPIGRVFGLDFIFENPLDDWHKKSLVWCAATDRDVNHNTIPPLKDVFFVDQSEPIVLNSDFILSDLVVDSLSTPLLVDDSTGDELSHKLIENLIQLDHEIHAVEAKMGQIVDILSNALRTRGNQEITAPHVYKSVDFDCSPGMECLVGHIQTNVLNKDNVNGLANDIVPLNRDQTIDQSMHFENLIADKNIMLNGLLNGINTEQIVTKSGNHMIVAPKTFANNVSANEVVVNHMINREIINPSTVLLTTGDQIVNNTLNFKGGIDVNNIRTNGPVSGVNIDKFFAEVVTKDGDHIIRGEKGFKNIELNELLMAIGSTIDGVDIMQVWRDVLWTYGDQVIESAVNFTELVIDGNLLVNGLVNGVKLPNDIIRVNENAVISAFKEFLATIKFDRMEVLNAINGIGLVGGQLDIMSKSADQVVPGRKTFTKMHLSGHSPVAGTVDGVDLSHLKQSLLISKAAQHFDVLEITRNAFFDAGLTLKTGINGLKIEDFYNNALKLTDGRIHGFQHFVMNNVAIKSLECLLINNLNIGLDLMTKNTDQPENNLTIAYINGVNFNFINDTVLYGLANYITGEKTFVGDLWVKNLRVDTINNISMADIVLVNRDEVITAPKQLENVIIYGDLNVHSFDSHIINGVHMNNFYANSLQYTKPQTFTGRPNFDTIIVPKATNFGTNSVNGVNLNHLMADAVLTNVRQIIVGQKTFISPVTIGSVIFKHTIDGVTDYLMRNGWLLQDVKQIINSDVIFEHMVRVNDGILMAKPVINNIDLNLLNDNTVKVDEPAVIGGVTRLTGNVDSKGHIRLNGRFQGIKLSEEAVRLNGDNTFKGQIHFTRGFATQQHLQTTGTVDGVKVEELCQFTVRHNQDLVISGPTQVTGNLVIKGPLNVNIGVNGMNIQDFFRNTLKVDKPLVFRGVKKFKVLIIEGPLDARQLVAGFRIEELANNYMSLSRDQTVNSKIIFLNDLTFNKNLHINGNLFTTNATINGINIHRLDSTVLKTFGHQLITGDITFGNNVHFDKDLNIQNRRINGLHLVDDLMLKGRDNVVTVPKIFAQDIVVTNDLIISDNKTVGGVDLSEMAKHSVLRNNGKYTIYGQKHFHRLEVDHLKVRLMNDMEISDRTLLLTFGNQTIFGAKVLNGDLIVNSAINANTVNNINIPKLANSLVLKGYNVTITAPKTFNSSLSVQNVEAFGRVDGVDLNELNYFIRLPIDLQDLRVRLGVEDKKIERLRTALSKQSYELDFYELHTTMPSGPPLLSYHNTDTDSQHLFITGQRLSNGCREVDVYANSRNGFELLSKLYTIDANLMTTFTSNGHQFVVVTNANNGPQAEQCLKMNTFTKLSHSGSGPQITQVFVFDGQQNKYNEIEIIHTHSVTDIDVIEDNTLNPCLLMAIPVVNRVKGQSIVVCLNGNGNFYLRETVPLLGRHRFTITRSNKFNRTLMASIKRWSPKEWKFSDIMISEWSSHLQHFDHSVQRIEFLNPIAIHLVDIPSDSATFLIAAEKKTSLTHKPLVRIFRYNHKRVDPFTEVQQIKRLEVTQIESVFLDHRRVLVLMLSKDILFVYQLKGASGFQRVYQMDVQNARSFIVSNNVKNGRIVGSLVSIDIYDCNVNDANCHQTVVLDSRLIGL
ncbi:unnamed protein product [Medioppia subpectinata]|uniref:Uncharacterized protein n=1 Tax=Medioppia subpectinata TaxID=1979941 RepID=A0A7R9KUU5_9ACAR|nr:unnamed protein product [Medioppia subpectinata]CAG2109890.1 unnamed protein product [Medioppia subpectinata]